MNIKPVVEFASYGLPYLLLSNAPSQKDVQAENHTLCPLHARTQETSLVQIINTTTLVLLKTDIADLLFFFFHQT